VISTGVLHHTRDARRAFAAITRKVKPGGIVVVGLYNAYGRVPTFLRSKVIGVLGPNIDHVVRTSIRDPRKADIWIKDQYFNPHETWHSMDEVLDWFDENGVRYLNCRPSLLGSNGEAADGLFSAGSSGVGYGVASDETYTSDLARETNRVGLNFGVSGFGGVGSLLVLRRELDLAPKFVVYGFWEDHLNRNVRPCLEGGTPFRQEHCSPSFTPIHHSPQNTLVHWHNSALLFSLHGRHHSPQSVPKLWTELWVQCFDV
jgi:hypothetical protein